MGLGLQIVMPGDGAPNPFTIAGTGRTYSCSAGSSIQIPHEDAEIAKTAGWVGAMNAGWVGAGATSGRPTTALQGQVYNDTTVGALVIFAGARTGWLNSQTGATA